MQIQKQIDNDWVHLIQTADGSWKVAKCVSKVDAVLPTIVIA